MLLEHLQQRAAQRGGYVLFAVVIVLVVLSLAGYRYADAMTTEYLAAYRNTEAAQAKANAVSGIYYAAGLLADPTTIPGSLSGDPNLGNFDLAAVPIGDESMRGGGRFTCFNVNPDSIADQEDWYGVGDEGGKLNINALIIADPTGAQLYNALMALPGMTAELADPIVDWVDADSSPRNKGAEQDDYPDYLVKNGPLNSIEELTLVKNMTPELLFGNDINLNGRLDANESSGNGMSASLSRGYSDFLTCYGRDINIGSNGLQRINLNDTNIQNLDANLSAVLGRQLADYLIYFRMTGSSVPAPENPKSVKEADPNELRQLVETGVKNNAQLRRKISSTLTIAQTMIQSPTPQMPPMQQGGTAGPPGPAYFFSPFNYPDVVNQTLPLLMDQVSTSAAYELPPRVNVNTAPAEVLSALAAISGGSTTTTGSSGSSGNTNSNAITAADVSAIVSRRSAQTPGALDTYTGAWLVTSGILTPAKFKTIEPYITGRSYTYRLQSVGYFVNGGPVSRVEAVIDVALGTPRILYFRDLSELGRGFTNLPK